MKQSTKDKLEGSLQELKGTLKERVGQIANAPELTAEGQVDQLAGKLQGKLGQVETVFEK